MFITPCETLGDLVEFTIPSNNKGSLQSITSCDRVSRDSRKFCCADNPTSPGCQQPDYDISLPHDVGPCTICGEFSDKKLISYLERLKKAIQEDYRHTIAEELVSYSFGWTMQDGSSCTVFNTQEFIQAYDKIMTPFFKDYILNFTYESRGEYCYINSGNRCNLGEISITDRGISHFMHPEFGAPNNPHPRLYEKIYPGDKGITLEE